jgi:hypothetical protein
MTESNLNLILTNALCCSATKAKEVSKLYSIGNSCADKELIKLKLLNDKIEVLRCYNFSTDINVTNDSINCLTEEQQDLMAHQIMATCDICDCQLTQ